VQFHCWRLSSKSSRGGNVGRATSAIILKFAVA
jgi:hypothetical protein